MIYTYVFKGLKYSKVVEPGFNTNQAYGGLYKAWIDFILKQNCEFDHQEHYVNLFKSYKVNPGIKVTDFSNIGSPSFKT